MQLEYICAISGDLKTMKLSDYEQDKTARWFSAECVSIVGHFYKINQYRHLWMHDKCIGTGARLVEEESKCN